MAQYRDPVKYEVGKDISPEQYAEALVKIADWFTESRSTKEPALRAKLLFQECLDGKTRDGRPWFGAGQASLTDRVKIKCRFDLDTMKPLRTASEARKKRKAREAERARERKKKDPMLPDEVAEVLGKDAVKYGSNPHVHLSTDEAEAWQKLYDAYLQQFPELRSVNASSELKIVCDLQVLADRYRMSALSGKAVAVEELAKITKELATLKSALGIHPDQIAKRVKPKTEATISAAALRLEEMGNSRELRERFFLEQMMQMYKMYSTRSADGLTYQLDEDKFFSQTMCRTCECASCGQRNVAGFKVEEIEDLLVREGILEPLDDAPAE